MEKLSKLIKPTLFTAPLVFGLWGEYINKSDLVFKLDPTITQLASVDESKINRILSGKEKNQEFDTELEKSFQQFHSNRINLPPSIIKDRFVLKNGKAYLRYFGQDGQYNNIQLNIKGLCEGNISSYLDQVSPNIAKFRNGYIECTDVKNNVLRISQQEIKDLSENVLSTYACLFISALTFMNVCLYAAITDEAKINNTKKKLFSGKLLYESVIKEVEGSDQIYFNSELLKGNNFSQEIDKRLNKESIVMLPKHKESIILLVNKLTEQIVEYYEQCFDIEIGKIDLTSHTNFCYIGAGVNPNIGGQVSLSGKLSNNLFSLRKEDIDQYFQGCMNEDKVKKFFHIIVHEIHHKLFNLDNRLGLKTGNNIINNFISKPKREGFIEYLTRNYTVCVSLNIRSLRYSHFVVISELSEKFKNINLSSKNEYCRYVAEVQIYLDALAECNSKANNIPFDQSRQAIEKLFVEFFLAGDKKIIDLAKSLGMKCVLDN